MKNKPFQQGDVNFEPVSSLPIGRKKAYLKRKREVCSYAWRILVLREQCTWRVCFLNAKL